MNKHKGLLGAAAAFGVLVGAATSAQATATVSGDFTILNGSPVASGGNVTFSLNGDGTIAASLVSTSGTTITGFGFDSLTINLPESNFAPATEDNDFGWVDVYGYQKSGFACIFCGVSETWTIGTPGEFTSVDQALGGGNSTHAFFFIDSSNQQWAADAVGLGVPEPSTWAIMLLGLGGLGAAMRSRRKLAAAAA